jgi:hypothetical protein
MKLITFIDSIGRNIIGEELSSSDGKLSVKNPAMINVAQAQNGQLQVQLIPLFFAEFIEESTRSQGSVWSFNTGSIALGDVQVDSRLKEQYTRVFSAAAVSPQTENEKDEESVIKLFDE